MKKTIFTLFAAAAILTSCKSPSTKEATVTSDTVATVPANTDSAAKDSTSASIVDSVAKK